jgi:allophanate hydrolase subunit 2
MSGAPDDHEPAIELLAGDLHLRFARETLLGVVGPARALVDGQPAAVGAAVLAPSGADVVVVHDGAGPVYVTVRGWEPLRQLGSAAADTFSGLGGGPITVGTELPGDPPRPSRELVGAFHRPLPDPVGPIRLVSVSHPDQDQFLAAPWAVAAVARSGIRITGGRVEASATVASAPTVPGAVQVTPSGEAIVLGPDGGLTGGYPVVAVVATCDLDRLSLLRPGDRVGFRVIDVSDAISAYRDRMASIRAALAHPDRLP